MNRFWILDFRFWIGSRKASIISFIVVALLLALCSSVEAQQGAGKISLIGFLHLGSSSNPVNARRLEAFRQALGDLGYIEGKTIKVESRYAEGRSELLSKLVEELVRLNSDVSGHIDGNSRPLGEKGHYYDSHRRGKHGEFERTR